MIWLYIWVVNLFPHLTFLTKFEPLCGRQKIIFLYMVFVCDPLNLLVVGGRSFSSTVTVCDPSTMFSLLMIVCSLVPYLPKGHPVNLHVPKNKLSG